jgi:hypothetical protein
MTLLQSCKTQKLKMKSKDPIRNLRGLAASVLMRTRQIGGGALKSFRSFVGNAIKHPKHIVWGKEQEASPLGIILLDAAGNRKLHEFLLGNPDKNLPAEITVNGKAYEVGIVSINPAPVVNTPSSIITQ